MLSKKYTSEASPTLGPGFARRGAGAEPRFTNERISFRVIKCYIELMVSNDNLCTESTEGGHR